jgi:hypothetical protein
MEEIEPGFSEKLASIMRKSGDIYNIVARKLLYRRYTRPWDRLSLDILRSHCSASSEKGV